jgi:hypothetical protein
MLRNVFWRAGGKPDQLDREYAREIRIAQTYGHAPAGQFAHAAENIDTSTLCKWTAQASQAGVSNFDGWKEIRIGRADEFAEAAEILAPIALTAEVHRHDGTTVAQRVSLYGTIRGASPEAGVALNCVMHKKVKPKDFLPPFLNAIVLAASGVKLPETFRAIVIGTESANSKEWMREFATIDRDSAIAYLTGVVSDLLSTGNDYFLPIEAVAEVVKVLRKPEEPHDLIETVDSFRFNDFSKNASQYGPVRNAGDFDPPSEEAIEEIVARRFKPIVGIFK